MFYGSVAEKQSQLFGHKELGNPLSNIKYWTFTFFYSANFTFLLVSITKSSFKISYRNISRASICMETVPPNPE